MLSNVTKSADVLRGNTEMQDLWLEVEKETYVADLKAPRVLTNAIMNGKVQNEKEEQEERERVAHQRQQANNWYMSDSAKKLRARKTDMPASQRKTIQQRLQKRPGHTPPRPKSPMGLGHVLATGEYGPGSPDRKEYVKPTPKSRAAVSAPGTIIKSERMTDKPFQGLTMRDFYRNEWTPSFEYRPADHKAVIKNGTIVKGGPWKNVEGFAMSTRTLERRKMDPFADINSFQGNAYSAKMTYANGYVRPLDVKGNLGARPVQQWKETLRETFAMDTDNFSSNAHDANLDALRAAMSENGGTPFSEIQ